MAVKFDTEYLYKYYSKNILKESTKQPLVESEIKYQMNTEFGKFFATLYYDTDPALVPSSFQVDYVYKIVFDLEEIKKEYSSMQINAKSDLDVSDDEIEKMISQKMKNTQQTIKPQKQVVNMDGFYNDVFKKNLPSYVLRNKLNDLIRAGVLPIGDFKIYAITYSTQVDDKLLFRKLEDAVKQNKPAFAERYGYQIAFESIDKKSAKGQEEIIQFVTEFSKGLEGSIFKDTQYYKITKK